MNYVYRIVRSPVGKLKLVGSDKGLAAVLWENEAPQRVRVRAGAEDNQHPVLLEAARQLTEYFQGKRESFSLELDMLGTGFQKAVWKQLLAIPFGETRSYGQLARQLGNPQASRAVGAANGRNPIAIVVPCHRVISSSGKLTGFAGGWKRKHTCCSWSNARPPVDLSGPSWNDMLRIRWRSESADGKFQGPGDKLATFLHRTAPLHFLSRRDPRANARTTGAFREKCQTSVRGKMSGLSQRKAEEWRPRSQFSGCDPGGGIRWVFRKLRRARKQPDPAGPGI
jgi:methylated-DNA-[protein]-cysteine S-methyltransferase